MIIVITSEGTLSKAILGDALSADAFQEVRKVRFQVDVCFGLRRSAEIARPVRS